MGFKQKAYVKNMYDIMQDFSFVGAEQAHVTGRVVYSLITETHFMRFMG